MISGPTFYPDLIQGGDEWIATRCGLLTASEMSRIITPSTLKPAKNDKASAHLYELLAQRITKYVEPHYISDDMLRGQVDEVEARKIYAQNFSPVQEVGFVTNNRWGFTIGCSPDGLVGEDGVIECKSRRQKFQVETIISGTMPPEYMIQVQTALMVTERAWCDFISYCGGLPMIVIRIHPDDAVISAISEAARFFEAQIADRLDAYRGALEAGATFIETERRVEQEMFV